VQDDIAGHFEEEIADEEQPRAQPVCRGAEPQVAVHRQRGEAEVDPV
jgi:hypothetical protein